MSSCMMVLQEPVRPSADLLGKNQKDLLFAAEKLNHDDQAQYYSQKLMEDHFPEETVILKKTYNRGSWV